MDTIRVIVKGGFKAQKEILRVLGIPVKEGLKVAQIWIKMR